MVLETVEIEVVEITRRFLSVKSAALYSDLSPDSIRRLIDRGDLVAHRPVRGKLLVDREQLDKLIVGSADRPQGSRGSSAHARERDSDGCFHRAKAKAKAPEDRRAPR